MTSRFKVRRHGTLTAATAFKTKASALKRSRLSPDQWRLSVDPVVVFGDLLPDLVESRDDFAWCRCPFHDDNNPSFSVNLRTGWYRCFSSSCGVTGSNIVSFVSALLAIEPSEARRRLEASYG